MRRGLVVASISVAAIVGALGYSAFVGRDPVHAQGPNCSVPKSWGTFKGGGPSGGGAGVLLFEDAQGTIRQFPLYGRGSDCDTITRK